jgi:hypothetical protein
LGFGRYVEFFGLPVVRVNLGFDVNALIVYQKKKKKNRGKSNILL